MTDIKKSEADLGISERGLYDLFRERGWTDVPNNGPVLLYYEKPKTWRGDDCQTVELDDKNVFTFKKNGTTFFCDIAQETAYQCQMSPDDVAKGNTKGDYVLVTMHPFKSLASDADNLLGPVQLGPSVVGRFNCDDGVIGPIRGLRHRSGTGPAPVKSPVP